MNKTLVKRVVVLGIAAIVFWQWITFSIGYGSNPRDHQAELEYDHLFHKGKRDNQLQSEIAEILKGSKEEPPTAKHGLTEDLTDQTANITYSLNGLKDLFGDDWHWRWIRMRVEQLWPEMCDVMREIERDSPNTLANRTRQRILIVPGMLTLTDFAHPDRAFHGGPLGELTQWADLISTLYLLGHKLTLRWDVRYIGIDLNLMAPPEKSHKPGCAGEAVDLIYTDLAGHSNFPPIVHEKYKNKFRILDAFGTEVMYNVPEYAKPRHLDRGAGMRDLNIKQFLTMYPEIPDNSFAGFMISKSINVNPVLEDIGVIYGKDVKYMRGKSSFVTKLQQYMEIHITVPKTPDSVHLDGMVNHGIVQSEAYREILAKAKYFIGLGDPIEGPGMLEAMARGCVIIQPAFSPPITLSGKPNNRSITSQVPYLENFGPPHVYTIDFSNAAQIETIFVETHKAQIKPLLPFEFSIRGYIERHNSYLENEQFCPEKTRWPPDVALRLHISDVPDQSCTSVCKQQKLICENSFFHLINTASIFKENSVQCQQTLHVNDVYAPAFDSTRTCLLQNDTRLFSCNSYSETKALRICPCRKDSDG